MRPTFRTVSSTAVRHSWTTIAPTRADLLPLPPMSARHPPAVVPAPETTARRLLAAFEPGEAIDPLTADHPNMDVNGAYAVQRALIAGHAAAGRRVVGHK